MNARLQGWLAIFLTAVLLMAIKWLHMGVTHYNWFLIILLSWTLILILWFRALGAGERKGSG